MCRVAVLHIENRYRFLFADHRIKSGTHACMSACYYLTSFTYVMVLTFFSLWFSNGTMAGKFRQRFFINVCEGKACENFSSQNSRASVRETKGQVKRVKKTFMDL